MKLKDLSLAFATLALVAAAGFAQAAGDAEAGAGKVAVCASCHGPDGRSISGQFPALAGQVPGYIAQQLALYKSGERQNALMAPMVANLSEQDMADIDAYYASLEPRVSAVSEEQAEAARRGERLYRGGYRDFEIPACMGCHGPTGNGIPPNYPKVSGQYAEYLEQQLHAFKDGTRSHDMMNPIAFKLSAEQISELALYMSAMN